MKIKKIFLLFSFIIIAFSPLLNAKVPNKDAKIQSLIYRSGINSLAYIPSYDIIPQLKSVMPSIPDSVWFDIARIYDTTNVIKDLEKRMKTMFNNSELDCLARLFDSELEIVGKLGDTASLIDFNRLTATYKMLDSISHFIQDTLGLNLNMDSSFIARGNKNKAEKNSDNKTDRARKKVRSSRKEKALSSADSMLIQSLEFISKYFEKASQRMMSAQKELLKSLNAGMKYYLEINKDLFKEYLLQEQRFRQREQKEKPRKNLDSVNRQLYQRFTEETKKLLEEFQKQREKLLDEIEKQNRSMQKQLKNWIDSLYHNESFIRPKNEGINCIDRNFFEKTHKFYYGLLKFRNEYDKKILEELKRRGFIVE